MRTSLCNVAPYTPILYSETGVYRGIFALKHRSWVFIRTASLRRFFALKHRSWVLVRTASLSEAVLTSTHNLHVCSEAVLTSNCNRCFIAKIRMERPPWPSG